MADKCKKLTRTLQLCEPLAFATSNRALVLQTLRSRDTGKTREPLVLPFLPHRHRDPRRPPSHQGAEQVSDLWINWRFGAWHLQIGPEGVRFSVNRYWINNKPPCWFERY